MKRLTVDEKIRIEGLIKTGMTGYEISDLTGRSEATITKIRKELERKGFDIWHRPGCLSRYVVAK